MTTSDLDQILDRIEVTIDKKVNGKIDGLRKLVETHNEKHEQDMREVKEHIVEVKPILETYRGFSTTGNFIKWIAGVGTAMGVLWMLVKGFFNFQ